MTLDGIDSWADLDGDDPLVTGLATAFLVGVRALGVVLVAAGIVVLVGAGSDPAGGLVTTGGFASVVRPRWTFWLVDLGRSAGTAVVESVGLA
jgi:hypothetical protein